MNQIQVPLIDNNEVMPGVCLTWLKAPQITSSARPGQFVMVRCGEEHELPLRRPLSIHQIDNGKLAILFTVMGKGTQWLSQRQTGDTLDLLGPLGNGFSIHPTSHNLLLLAGGIGIAPLCFLSQQALEQGHSVTILSGASTSAQLYPEHLLPPKVNLATVTEDGTAGKKGMLTDFLPDFIDGADQVFACGPPPMYRTMSLQKQQFQGKPVQISLEVRMGCGLGVCYGCTIKTKNGLKQVCQDGPIFDLDDILWDELNLTGV
ncbi:Dihydroorotate dehydrogenase B (NAD(+)), electron transfer subunit [subsurface metagenome]